MKTSLTYLSTIIFFILATKVHGQETDTLQSETILKVNPYGKGKTKWLNNNGFKTDLYEWNDADINLNLQKAVKRTRSANIIGVTGGTVFVLNLLYNSLGRFAHAFNEYADKGDYEPDKKLYRIGGTMMATSLVIQINAESKLKKAKEKYERKRK